MQPWEGLKQESNSTFIPEQLPKPLQLFHGITLDGQIKIPSLNDGSAQKRKTDDKRGEHGGQNSWVYAAAKSSFFFMPLLLFSLEEVVGEEEDRLFSL